MWHRLSFLNSSNFRREGYVSSTRRPLRLHHSPTSISGGIRGCPRCVGVAYPLNTGTMPKYLAPSDYLYSQPLPLCHLGIAVTCSTSYNVCRNNKRNKDTQGRRGECLQDTPHSIHLLYTRFLISQHKPEIILSQGGLTFTETGCRMVVLC